MKRYSSKTSNFFPSGIIFGGYILLGFSMAIAVISNLVIGILFALLSLLVITGKEGLVIDNRKHRLKFYWGIFGLHFGKFETIPPLEKILLVPVKKATRATSYGGRISFFYQRKYQVRLQYKEFNDYILAYEGNLKNGRKKAEILRDMLKLRLIDNTRKV